MVGKSTTDRAVRSRRRAASLQIASLFCEKWGTMRRHAADVDGWETPIGALVTLDKVEQG